MLGNPTFSQIWAQCQGRNGHVFNGLWVEAKNAKVVNGVSVHWVCVNFFVVIEDDIAPKWARSNDMAIRKDVTAKSKRQQGLLRHDWPHGPRL